MQQHRAELYGDGFFETIYCENGSAPLLPFHHQRIIKSAAALGISLGEYFGYEKLRQSIQDMFPAGKLRLRLDIFRKHGLGYTPTDHEACWIWHYNPVEDFQTGCSGITQALAVHSVASLSGLILSLPERKTGVSQYIKFADQVGLSAVKSISALIYVMASKELHNRGLDEIVLLNQYGRVCETQHSNIYVFLNDKIFTPPLSEGPIDGVMRAWLLHTFQKDIYEKSLERELLNHPDAIIFSSNAIRGLSRLSHEQV